MDVHDARTRLVSLKAERFQALELDIEYPSPYMTRLEQAIADAHHDYVLVAVLQVATLRGELAGAARG